MSTVITDQDAEPFLSALAKRNSHALQIYPQHEMYDCTATVYRCLGCGGVAQLNRRPGGIVLDVMHRLSRACVREEWETFEFPAEFVEVTS